MPKGGSKFFLKFFILKNRDYPLYKFLLKISCTTLMSAACWLYCHHLEKHIKENVESLEAHVIQELNHKLKDRWNLSKGIYKCKNTAEPQECKTNFYSKGWREMSYKIQIFRIMKDFPIFRAKAIINSQKLQNPDIQVRNKSSIRLKKNWL